MESKHNFWTHRIIVLQNGNNLRIHADHLRSRNVAENTTPLQLKESDLSNIPDIEWTDISESIILYTDRGAIPDQDLISCPGSEKIQLSPRSSTRIRNSSKMLSW